MVSNICYLKICRAVKEDKWEAEGWADDAAYSVSKLGDTLLVRAMQQEFNRSPEKDIVVNAVSE